MRPQADVLSCLADSTDTRHVFAGFPTGSDSFKYQKKKNYKFYVLT